MNYKCKDCHFAVWEPWVVCLGSTDASFNLVGGFPEPTFARLGNLTRTYPVLYWQKPTICPVFIHVQKICVCCFGAILQHQLEAVEAAEENLCMVARTLKLSHATCKSRYLAHYGEESFLRSHQKRLVIITHLLYLRRRRRFFQQ